MTFSNRTVEADWSAEFEYPDRDITTAEAALTLSYDGKMLLEYLKNEQNTLAV